jgi:hypothetical protein
MKQELVRIFRLEGESKAAADRYIKLQRTAKRPFDEDTKAEIHKIAHIFGLDHPVIRIDHYCDGLPRAYQARPQIYVHPHRPSSYFMYSPVGYNEDVFCPKDGTPASSKELMMLAHSEPEGFLFPNREDGVATPGDYDPETAIHRRVNAGIVQPDRKYIFFGPNNSSVIRAAAGHGPLNQCFNWQGHPLSLEFGPEQQQPLIRRLVPGITLAYRCDDPDRETFCPEGFKRLSPIEYQWFAADIDDIQNGINLPPAPNRKLMALSQEHAP